MTSRIRGLDRRSFLAGTAATGLSSGMIPGIAWSAADTTPKRGGTIRHAKGHGNTNDTLDPATWTNGFTVALPLGMHGYLTKVATDGTAEPDLAESWDATPDARTWRFRIRGG